MRLHTLAFAFGLVALTAAAAPPQARLQADHVADHECLACHADQASRWQGSKHDRAMQPASAQTILGDFAGARFAGPGGQAHFFRRGDRFLVATEGADGTVAEFPVTHTFGVYPLQQYLLPLPGGRLQALSIAWDVRKDEWFSLYPEGGIAPGSNLHWSGRYQNWNLMCAECHTTAFSKQYDDADDRYASTWVAPNVGCQACHGPSRAHVDSARRMAAGKAVVQAQLWSKVPRTTQDAAGPAPTPNHALAPGHAQVDQCASCHSRRTRLREITVPGEPFLDNFMPDNLRADLYHADGQQLEEVFEYGSYRQSRMYQAGVGCTACHDPHSGKPHAEGNTLCVRCHSATPDPRYTGLQARAYDTPAHHFHTPGTAGSQCVDCHMPIRIYMVVHDRRDHAIRVPRPDLTRKLGTPNPCQACHADQSPEWAVAAIERHLGPRRQLEHYGELLDAARRLEPGAGARLADLTTSPDRPAIVRATAIETLAGIDPMAVPPATLVDADPVVRATAAAAFSTRPAVDRMTTLTPLLDDPVRAVRITAARGLADIGATQLGPGRSRLRDTRLQEFVEAQMAMADMPGAQLNLAALFLTQRDTAAAERHYRRALAQDAALDAARLSLASLLATTSRDDEAASLLREGLGTSSNPGELHFALGLLAGQRQRWDEAARELQRAATLLPDDARIRRNLEPTLRYLQQSGQR